MQVDRGKVQDSFKYQLATLYFHSLIDQIIVRFRKQQNTTNKLLISGTADAQIFTPGHLPSSAAGHCIRFGVFAG